MSHLSDWSDTIKRMGEEREAERAALAVRLREETDKLNPALFENEELLDLYVQTTQRSFNNWDDADTAFQYSRAAGLMKAELLRRLRRKPRYKDKRA